MKEKIIDIHCHIFPEKVAEKAVDAIGKYYNIKMFSSRGTVDELLESGEKIGVYRYVVHSTATRVEQVEPINSFIAEAVAQNKSFIGFGTLHPGIDNMDAEIDKIKAMGLKGIKLHPEFQNFSLDDKDVQSIFKAAEGCLPVLVHMGDENKATSSPDKLAAILDRYPKLVVIGAHLGGYSAWNDSMKYLVGKNLYFDSSSTLFKLDIDIARDMIRRHGVDKVLFGTDYPMWGHLDELERFDRLGLTTDERQAILFGNASRLLGIG